MPTVTIWNEFLHETEDSDVGRLCRQHYPNGIHSQIEAALKPHFPGWNFRTATLGEPQCGLCDEVIGSTDVLVWWGHMAHHRVPDEIVAKLHMRLLSGMGLVVLHSGHFSKIFQRACGTHCELKWREIGEKERVWTVDPFHPVAKGIPETFAIDETEMYGEPFGIPGDAHVVFMSWYQGGNVFRSGFTLQRGAGKVFYFSPGHETLPIYHNENVIKVIANGVKWVNPESGVGSPPPCPNEKEPYEKV